MGESKCERVGCVSFFLEKERCVSLLAELASFVISGPGTAELAALQHQLRDLGFWGGGRALFEISFERLPLTILTLKDSF